MEKKKIQALLQKYYDDTLGLEEEMLLVALLEDSNLPEEYVLDKEQVLGMIEIKNEDIPLPKDLELDIIKHLEPIQKQDQKKVRNLRPLYTITSVAASLALIVSVLFFLNRQPDYGSFDDPELAYAETKQALEMVSKYFSKGTEKIESLEKIETAIHPLSNLKKVNEAQKSLEHLKSFDQGLSTTQGLVKFEK